jgi:hypothetical protein
MAGPSTKDTENITPVVFGQKVYTKLRRFVVVRDMPDHCLCLAIHTNNGRGDKKFTKKPQDQYFVFEADESFDRLRVLKKELPVIVETSDPLMGIKYPLSLLDCTRLFTIEHSHSVVRKIGRVDKAGLPLLEECFRQAMGVPVDLEKNEVCSLFI